MPLCSKPGYTIITTTIMILAATAIAANAPYPIAGVNPAERPAGAPTQTALKKTNDWYAHAVTGVEEPYPASLEFLESQGRWYTPFNRPGMPGRYDIRGWHANKK